MQINYTGFRPNIKGVNIKKSYILDNIYHIEAVRADKRPVCCDRHMNIKITEQFILKILIMVLKKS